MINAVEIILACALALAAIGVVVAAAADYWRRGR